MCIRDSLNFWNGRFWLFTPGTSSRKNVVHTFYSSADFQTWVPEGTHTSSSLHLADVGYFHEEQANFKGLVKRSIKQMFTAGDQLYIKVNDGELFTTGMRDDSASVAKSCEREVYVIDSSIMLRKKYHTDRTLWDLDDINDINLYDALPEIYSPKNLKKVTLKLYDNGDHRCYLLMPYILSLIHISEPTRPY